MRIASNVRNASLAVVTSCALTMAPVVPTLGTAPVFANPSVAAVAQGDEDPQTTLRVATAGFVDSFNPFTSVYLTPTMLNRYMYENLVQYSAEDGSPTEGLAKEWSTENDGKRWVFTLQDNLVWSDDQPITSEDVKWTYDQMLNDENMAVANGSLVSNFESVEAPDDKTVVINLKEAQAPNPGTEIPIVPKHVWEKIDNPSEFPNDASSGEFVGSGPFTLEQYQANETIVLKANPKFWRGGPKMDRIQYIYYTDADAQVQALRSGDVDLVSGLSAEQFENLKSEDNIEAHSGMGRRYTSIAINPGQQTRDGKPYGDSNPALKDVKVRQAIRLGIDAQTLLDRANGGQGVLATSFVPASFPKWHLKEDNPVIKSFDPEGAKKLLDEAGWKPGADGIREKDGEKLSLELLIDSTDTVEQSSAEFLGPWMKDIGIDLKVTSSDSDTISARSIAGDYDMYFSGWSLNPDPDYQLGINTCMSLPTKTDGSGGTTQDGWCNPEFDKLYQQQRTELDETKRQEIVQQMLAMNYEETPQVALWYGNSLEAYRKDRVTGFTLQPKDTGTISGQSGYWGFLTVEPVEGAQAREGGPKTGIFIALGAVVLVIVVGGAIALARKRKSDDIE